MEEAKMDICVFIATSIDGYIAESNGGMDWLLEIDNNGIDTGYETYIQNIDAIIMGRNTFDFVKNIDPWPYNIPVYVLTKTLKIIDSRLKYKIALIKGTPKELMNEMENKKYKRIYIDGGKTIQGFLKEDLVTEMTITTVAKTLGNGIRLFGEENEIKEFDIVEFKKLSNKMVQTKYKRVKTK
jgi:dihydrofolate reductase